MGGSNSVTYTSLSPQAMKSGATAGEECSCSVARREGGPCQRRVFAYPGAPSRSWARSDSPRGSDRGRRTGHATCRPTVSAQRRLRFSPGLWWGWSEEKEGWGTRERAPQPPRAAGLGGWAGPTPAVAAGRAHLWRHGEPPEAIGPGSSLNRSQRGHSSESPGGGGGSARVINFRPREKDN